MEISGLLPKRAMSVAVVFACAIGLTGCFDLEQKVAVNSNGGGNYAVVVAADGLVGDALKKKHADVDIIGDQQAITHVTRTDGKTVQTSEIAFKDLSDLKLGDETIALHVKGKKLLGLGGTEVNFHRTFRIDEARRHHHDIDDDNGGDLGHDILTSMFGDHTYTFAVWLPGSIEHIAPVRLGDRVVYPQVWGDKYGHTVVWKMKLVDMMLSQRLDFDVDFAAHGNFKDSASIYDPHGHHHDISM
jgi:hypothetical protein